KDEIYYRHRIVGFSENGKGPKAGGVMRNIQPFNRDEQNDKSSYALCASTNKDLGSLYISHIFSAFMWELSKHIRQIDTTAKFSEDYHLDPKDEASWNSLKLQTALITDLAGRIHSSG